MLQLLQTIYYTLIFKYLLIYKQVTFRIISFIVGLKRFVEPEALQKK